MNSLNMINLNASRCRNIGKVREIYNFLGEYDPIIVCIQEINIATAIKIFSGAYQVFPNIEDQSKDGVGIVTLVRSNVEVKDVILGINGRIIGVWIDDIQIWNVYPKSGSAFKKDREVFFREELSDLYTQWKDKTKFIFQMGDHNCTHRMEDSLYNPVQHIQQGLINHLQIYGMADDFLKMHGYDTVIYSRITETSKTRIDYVFSNSNACVYFQYLPVNGLDHRVVLARYELSIEGSRECIPSDRYFNGWSIPKSLENDKEFLSQAQYIIQSIHRDSLGSSDYDPSYHWLKFKTAVVQLACVREKQIRKEVNDRMRLLKGYYSLIIKDIGEGKDCFQELQEVKMKMQKIYTERSREKIDKMRCLQIENHMYDIHTLQNRKKYEAQTKIREIQIDGVNYKGIKDVVKAIQDKIANEVEAYEESNLEDSITAEEDFFLSKLDAVELTDEERCKLLEPTSEEEIEYILKNEVDLDSSPGEDGLTYRIIKKFWIWQEFRSLYLNFLNFTRKENCTGLIENCGIIYLFSYAYTLTKVL